MGLQDLLSGAADAFQAIPDALAGPEPQLDPSIAQMLPKGALQQAQDQRQPNFWANFNQASGNGQGLWGALGQAQNVANNQFNGALMRSIQDANMLRANRQQQQADAARAQFLADPTVDPQEKMLVSMGGNDAMQRIIEQRFITKQQIQARADAAAAAAAARNPDIKGSGAPNEPYLQIWNPTTKQFENRPNSNYNPAITAQQTGKGAPADPTVIKEYASQVGLGAIPLRNVPSNRRDEVVKYLGDSGVWGMDSLQAKAEATAMNTAIKNVSDRQATYETAAQEIQPLADNMIAAMKNVYRTSYMPVNNIISKVKTAGGSAEELQLSTAYQSLANTYARVMSAGNGGTTDAAMNHALDLFSKAQDQKQAIGVANQLMKETKAVLQGSDMARELVMNPNRYPNLMRIQQALGIPMSKAAVLGSKPMERDAPGSWDADGNYTAGAAAPGPGPAGPGPAPPGPVTPPPAAPKKQVKVMDASAPGGYRIELR